MSFCLHNAVQLSIVISLLQTSNYVNMTQYQRVLDLIFDKKPQTGSYVATVLHVIYVIWAGGICLICTHKPEGECGHIRQIPTAHVTYVM